MNKFIRIVPVLLTALVVFAIATPASAADPGKNWRVYNVKPATSSFWDINKTQAYTGGIGLLQFPIQQFDSEITGSFAVYLLNNYNVNITGQTLTATASWTGGSYLNRSVSGSAYVRLEFQDVTAGPYTSNDYWWSTGTAAPLALDLNAGTSGTLTASLTEAGRAQWTNLCGQSATDTTVYAGPDCGLGGTYPAVSPYDGFTNAMKNVKQLGLSFGNASRYASGVALDGGTGIFRVQSFTITP
jgi:hypothetical protein